MLGSTEPRLWTPPLRELTPATSRGFDHAEFARDLGRPFDPWQEFAAIHAGELLPDGRPRFRIVLVLVARQNGKTELPVILSTYWQFIDEVPLILGTSTKVEYAKESWVKARDLIESCGMLDRYHAPSPRWYRETNGEQESWTWKLDAQGEGIPRSRRSRYKIAASNAEGGRSLTVHRLVLDELRQHHDYEAWNAAEPATSAAWDAQIWCMSNAGDDRSVVLNDLHAQALDMIEYLGEHEGAGYGELLAAGHDPRLGLFEWSAPSDADPTDIHALAQANPNLNRRIEGDALLAKAYRAVKRGGAALTGFKTEYMCIKVDRLDPAVDPSRWRACLDVGSLDSARHRSAWCLDVAPDERHATVVAAAVMGDGRVRLDVVRAWDSVNDMRRDLPALLARNHPATLGWFPSGPAAAFAADLRAPQTGRRVEIAEIRGDSPSVCMGFAELVKAEMIAHSDDPLLNSHVGGAGRLRRGDVWVFARRGKRTAGPGSGEPEVEAHCDAAYAAAGAAHLARTLPAPVGRPRLVTVDDDD